VSNLIQPYAKQAFNFSGWGSASIKVALISAGYTYSASHHNLSDLSNIVATSANLSSLTNTLGVLDAADYTFTALTGATVTQAWLYLDTGVAGTSTLLIYINQGIGLPFTPNGTDLQIEWMPQGIGSL
jgi:hypothetical protein